MSKSVLTFARPNAARPDRRPRLSIVVPVFRHSGLVREAMYSLARQAEFEDVDVVFVDDGCPDPQTYTTLTPFAARWRNVHYVRQVNGGLSAARNRGIAFTLRHLPEAEGLYFLDADNFLSSYSIAAMQAALRDHPADDWFYPDIRMFGLRIFNDYSGEFNAYAASVVNICEAGSLIRRRMIESDLRFDENMHLGYEDWDFWLSAIERGFRGRHLPSLGLSYRKRAESMLASASRCDSQIREYIRRKHEHLFQINAFANLEHRELPRFALLRSDEACVEMATDLQLGGLRIGRQAFETRLWQAIREPTFISSGQYMATTTGPLIDLLRRSGLMRWLSIEIEQALDGHNFVSLTVVTSADKTLRLRRGRSFSPRSHLFAVSQHVLRDILLDTVESWIAKLPEAGASYNVACLEIAVPQEVAATPALKDVAVSDFVQLCLHARCNPMRTQPNNLVEDVHLASRPLDEMPPRARIHFDNARIPPIAQAREGRIAFVLPHCDFGGAEKVTFCLAGEMRRLGFATSLILLGDEVVYRAMHAVDAFDDIYILDGRNRIVPWSGAPFLGTKLPVVQDEQWARELSNILATFEMVISCHSAEVLGLLSGLRRHGVMTATYLHLFDKSAIGGYRGHPMLALAYEHALDLVLTCSDMLATDMASLGIPRCKILSLPNAASLKPIKAGEDDRSRAGRPIRVLYIGRIDIQKGLDRLADVVDVIGADPDYEVRIIGKSILTNGKASLNRHSRLIEPPIYDDAGLSEAYRWADILLLPSRYEGLPLTVLEAMAHGVVPIVADCGAVTEAVESGVSGFIVPQERCVETMLEHLRALASDDARRAAMSKAVRQRVALRSWSALAERLRERIQVFRRLRAKSHADRAAAGRAVA